ncbi:hypothetical protein ABFS83_12G134800 [Erythranthe nasuta]
MKKIQVSRENIQLLFVKAKPFLAVIFLQLGVAGLDIICKAALNEGMSSYVFVVYRHVIATVFIAPFALVLEKKIRPKMTTSVFAKIVLLSLLEPIIDQNLYFLGMKYTTATFAAAMGNVLPAITFIMACLFRLEKVKLTSKHSQAKMVGTLTTVTGAMIMTLGAIMIAIGCLCWACFMILQVITLRAYPAELSLTAWICVLGAVEGGIVALIMEKDKLAWSLKWDIKLLAVAYSGIVCSGIAYYVQGVVLRERGPVFVTAFSPLSMVLVAVLSSFILSEQMYLGRVIGAIIIIMGLYLVIWGKKKDYNSTSNEEQEMQVNQSVDVNSQSC